MNKIKVRILFIFSRHSQSWPSHTAGCSASFTYQPKVLINSNPTAPPYPASCIPPYPTNPAVSHRPAISYRCWRRAERLKVPILQVARNFSQKLRVDIQWDMQWEQHIRLVYGVLSGGHRDMESYICRYWKGLLLCRKSGGQFNREIGISIDFSIELSIEFFGAMQYKKTKLKTQLKSQLRFQFLY